MLPVSGTLSLEIDKQKLGDLFYSLKSDFKEEQKRFSSMVFNLKHMFTQSNSFQSSFEINIPDIELIEPYRFELNINPMIESAYLSFLIENAIKTADIELEVVDSDLLIEASPDSRDTRPSSAVLSLISHFIFNKNKIARIKPGERINLLSKLSISEQFQDIDERVEHIYEKCQSCAKKAGHIPPQKELSRSQGNRLNFISKLRIENISGSSDTSHHSTLSALPRKAKQASSRNLGDLVSVQQSSSAFTPSQHNQNWPVIDRKNLNFEAVSVSKYSGDNGAVSVPASVSPHNLETIYENPRCQCIHSVQNYLSTKIRVTYLAFVRFSDGTNSLLKAETLWLLSDEPPIKLLVNLKGSKANLNESVVLHFTIENNTTEELKLSITENCFHFGSDEETTVGAMILENKIAKTIYIPAYTKDTIALSFTPIKSGLIQLKRVSLFDVNLKKTLNFECNYKILIS